MEDTTTDTATTISGNDNSNIINSSAITDFERYSLYGLGLQKNNFNYSNPR